MAKKAVADPDPPVTREAVPDWQPPEGCLVSGTKSYTLVIDGVRYEHISEAPDGRWVYARS